MRVTAREGRIVLALTGEVDIATAPYLRAVLLSTLRRGVDVELDLRDVGFMDSQGVAVIAAAARIARATGTPLSVRGTPAPIRLLLSVTGLGPTLDCHPPILTGMLSN